MVKLLIVDAMNYEDWSAAELEAELAKLQEFRVLNFMCHQKKRMIMI